MASKRRRGRPRKTGERFRGGRLKPVMPESPRERAARMPHRRALGERASDPAAESELGRMRLRGELTEAEVTAGEIYARMWRGYVATLSAPGTPGEGQGRVSACGGCPSPETRKWCLCDMRRRIYAEATGVLVGVGRGIAPLVRAVVIYDQRCHWAQLPALELGLIALAKHYGVLTNQENRMIKTTLPQIVRPVTP